MAEVLNSIGTWFHALATVVFIGHFILMALIYIPAAVKSQPASVAGAILAEISRLSRNWMYTSLGLLAVTGSQLTLVDTNYNGVGNFSNTWSVLMLVKHLLIMGMLAAGFWYNRILRVGPMMLNKADPAQAIRRFRTYINSMAAAGVVVLLLTAFSQFK